MNERCEGAGFSSSAPRRLRAIRVAPHDALKLSVQPCGCKIAPSCLHRAETGKTELFTGLWGLSRYAKIGLFLRCAIRVTQTACAVCDLAYVHARTEQGPSRTKF